MEVITIREFDELLQRHDWHYGYSDDASVRQRGFEAEQRIERLAQLSPQHDLLYRAYKTYRYREGSGEATTEQKLALKSARIASGATTAEELKQREQQLAEQERLRVEAAARRRQDLLADMESLCNLHDWFYWRYDIDSKRYQQGSAERRQMLDLIGAYRWDLPELAELFHAWANFKNETNGTTMVALSEVQRRLGLPT